MIRTLVFCGVFAWLGVSPAWAGGGPETTLVVANAADPSSVRVANTYAAGRDIPPRHVLYLEGVPQSPTLGIDDFRSRILEPIEAYLEAEGLADDVDLIAYSVGFPYAVSFDADVQAKGIELPRPISKMASLTSMTYFHRLVAAKDAEAYLSLEANRYFRRDNAPNPSAPPQFGAGDVARIRTYQGALRSKDYRQAAEALEALLADFPGMAAFWYDLACCRALLVDPDEAMAALEKAVEHGFQQAEHARQDPDLDSLRELPGFAALIAAMEEARGALRPEPARGFTSRTAWGQDGAPTDDGDSPHRYRLAVMLGWTGKHGNTVAEVLAALERARASDGTMPDGTVYLMKNGDVRSTTRAPWFDALKAAMGRLGRRVEILARGQGNPDGALPRGRDDAIGVLAGLAKVAFQPTDPPLLPGAIAEHLTSFGAHFNTPSQTKCTVFIRQGAAGTSGTVAEPFAIANKFPSPWIHLHYAQGVNLAEAFYLSVAGPYQLLILGDPLARPFAKGAGVRIDAPAAGARVSGAVPVEFSLDLPVGARVDRVELWVDGRKVGEAAPSETLAWDATGAEDGAHELRVVAVEAGLVATRSSAIRWIETDADAGLGVTVQAPEPVRLGDDVEIRGRAEGATQVEILRGTSVLATAEVNRGRWKVKLPAMQLALGPSRLQARGLGREGARTLSPLFLVEVGAPTELWVPQILDRARALPGLRLEVEDADGVRREAYVSTLAAPGRARALRDDLDALGVRGAPKARISGSFRASEGLAELWIRGAATARVDDVDLELGTTSPEGWQLAVLPLAEGWHGLEVEAAPDAIHRLAVELGGSRVRAPLAGADLAHLPEDWVMADAASSVRPGEGTAPTKVLTDGGRVGNRGVDVDSERGIVLTWDEKQKKVRAAVLHAATGKDIPPIELEWIVEARTSKRGRWRPLKGLEIVTAPTVRKLKKDEAPPGPRFLLLRFKRTSALALRIRPAEVGASSKLAEVEVYRED